MTRVLIAEDQGMMRGALATLLDLEDDLEVVAQVGSGDLVVPSARETRPGARGFIVEDGPVEDLARSIRRVLAGELVIDPALATAAVVMGPSPLTPRERDVLNAAADGATVTDISARTHLSGSTVRNYLSDAIGKTGTRNRMEAVRVARENGWL